MVVLELKTRPVASSVTTAFARVTTAPPRSMTVPSMLPFGACAHVLAHTNSRTDNECPKSPIVRKEVPSLVALLRRQTGQRLGNGFCRDIGGTLLRPKTRC